MNTATFVFSEGQLLNKLNGALDKGLRKRFEKTLKLKKMADNSVDEGRAYVEAYVSFLHYVENLHSALNGKHDEH